MTEDEARDWISNAFGRKALTVLERFTELLLAEAASQSLIARSTFDTVWHRHILDSAQLVPLAPAAGTWLDIGSGGGLPGLVVAILRESPVIMIEPRRKRCEFLHQAAAQLELTNVTVIHGSAQGFAGRAGVVSARAVAAMNEIFAWTRAAVSRETVYVLPRGKHAGDDIAVAAQAWDGVFHVKQSLTNSESGIVVASGVSRK